MLLCLSICQSVCFFFHPHKRHSDRSFHPSSTLFVIWWIIHFFYSTIKYNSLILSFSSIWGEYTEENLQACLVCLFVHNAVITHSLLIVYWRCNELLGQCNLLIMCDIHMLVVKSNHTHENLYVTLLSNNLPYILKQSSAHIVAKQCIHLVCRCMHFRISVYTL